MEVPGQGVPAELAHELPALTLSSPPHADAGEIEAEVMNPFGQYRVPLLRYAVSVGVSIPDAEEIVQEVFLSLFRHLRLGRSRQNLRGWIFRVAHNLTLKRRYSNTRRQDAIEIDDEIVRQERDPSPTPEESFSDMERQQRLLTVVRALPAIEQSCIRLRAEGLRYREIAKVLGISLGSVSTFLARSLSKLSFVDRR